ncbi:hypothetical protein GKQ77_27140, partial [Streptomyces sp. BG9H]|nr:hypothetical protein [Streptomyces anatolicus]
MTEHARDAGASGGGRRGVLRAGAAVTATGVGAALGAALGGGLLAGCG